MRSSSVLSHRLWTLWKVAESLIHVSVILSRLQTLHEVTSQNSLIETELRRQGRMLKCLRHVIDLDECLFFVLFSCLIVFAGRRISLPEPSRFDGAGALFKLFSCPSK